MKRFLTFLALCCLMAAGAWAQYNVIVGAPVDISSLAAGSQTDVLMYAGGDGTYGFVHTPSNRFTIDASFTGASAIVDNAYFFKLIKNDDGTVSVKNYAGNYIPGYSNSSNGDYGPGAANGSGYVINFTVETNTSTTNVREGGFAYTLTADRENGLPVEKNGDHFGIKKDNQYIIPLQFCTYTCTALPVADALKGNFINVASDAATTIEEGWYMLNNKGRNNYVADNYTAFKMVGSKPSGNQQAYSYAGQLFYIAPSATEGKWNISSGYGHYVSLGNNSSAITTDKHDFTIELITVDGNTDVFYFKDDNTGYVANGQQTNSNFVGWGSTVPTALSGNSQYRFYKAEVISLPVKTVATVNDLDDATWYQLTVRNQYVKYDAASGTYYDTYGSRPAEDDYTSLFAFVGDDPSGYKIVNYSAGFDKAMGADNANTNTRLKSVDFDAARSYYFKPVTISGNPGWQIYDKATPAAYLNQQGTNMGYWQGGGNGDLGNAFTFTEVEVVPVIPAVVVPHTLNPEDKATVESLEKVSVKFSVAEGAYYPYMASDYAKPEVLPYFSKGGTNVMASLAKNSEDEGLFEITPSETLSDGEWTLTIPEGAFWIWNGDLDAEAQPVAEITATYTVATTAVDEITTFNYGWLPGTATPDAQWTAWTGDVPEGISTQNEFCTADNLYVITKRYEFTNEQNNLQVTFQHQGGNQRTEIVGVDVIAEDGTVYSDYHHGYTGSSKDANVYTINNIPAGTYTVRYITTKHWGSEQNTQIKGYITPVVTEPTPQITDLTQLSNDKAYVLICQRGQLSTSDGQLVPVVAGDDKYTAEANKFAIIKSGDKYYLWSVAEEGYVRSDKVITDRLSAQEITLTHQDDDTFLLILNDKGVNMQNNAANIILDGYKTPDAGNKYAIYEVDDFADAETAIAAIPGWAPTAGKVYTIKAHFTGEDYTDLYLSSDTSAEQLLLPMPTKATATQSYWVAEASGNADRPWKFKSGYGYAKYLDWQNGGLTASGDNFKLLECSNVIFDHHLNVNTGDRNIGTWADASKGFGAVGQGGCWAGTRNHANSNWTTDYTIEEVTGVDVYTVSGNATTGVTGISGYTYASSIGNGSVVIVPTGTELTSANFTTASDVEVIINSEAKTIAVVSKIEAGIHYMTIENKDTGRQPFLYNDVRYADEITLQSTAANTNGHIWKLTFDSDGNITEVKNAENGKGIKPKSNNCSSTLTSFTCERATPGYYYLKSSEITGGHDRLNAASNNTYHNEANLRAVTTWEGEHTDNEWRFNIVNAEGMEEYNVVVSPADCHGYAVYGGKKAGDGGFFLASSIEESELAGGDVVGYIFDGLSLNAETKTITVNYHETDPIQVTYKLYLKDGDNSEKLLATATEAVTEYIGKVPSAVPFDCPEYVTFTYPELENGVFAAENTEVKIVSDYNDLMPFVPGQQTTVDIDVRNHYYFHVEKRTITIDNVEQEIWVPCISPKAPTFDDDAAYIWVMEGDWYNGFRFHNDQIAKEAAGGDGTACHITFHHHEILSNTMEKMEGMKGETSLTEKTYTLVSNDAWNEKQTRATLTADANDTHSYFDLIYAPVEDQNPNYRKDHPDWQFRIHGTATGFKNKGAGWYLNFRDYKDTGDNPDSLLCIYNGGAAYADRASSFTFHKNEVCTEDDRQAVLAMIDAIEKGAVGAIIDKTAQEYQDLLTLKGRIEDTTIGCTRALFDVYTEKLVKYAGEKKTPADGEAYRLAVRTKEGRNFYLKDDGTYTTDSLDAAIYVLGSSADGTKKILAGNNNEDLYYFRNGGLTQDVYAEGDCDFNYELMAGKETVADVLDATGAAKYATVCLTDGNGKVATMTSPDKATATGTCTWEEPQEVVYMNDELSSAIVMEPVPYPYTHPNFAHGTSDGRQGGFATIWLPFPMHFPDGIEVYKGTYMRDAKTGEICPYLMLTEVDKGNVTAAGGYLLYNAEQTESKMKQLVLPAPANPEDLREEEDAAFIGSTENPGQTGDATLWTEKFVNEYGDDFIPYVLADKSKDGKGIGFFRYTGATYPKGKAIYLSPKPAQGEAPAECIMFSFDDVIEAIESLHGHAITSEIYDLQGHRLNKVQKGQINVINGTKVMFK